MYKIKYFLRMTTILTTKFCTLTEQAEQLEPLFIAVWNAKWDTTTLENS